MDGEMGRDAPRMAEPARGWGEMDGERKKDDFIMTCINLLFPKLFFRN
jgi:hypothetical protein